MIAGEVDRTCNPVQFATRNFDLCVQCSDMEEHPHKMELDFDDASSSDQKQRNLQEARKLSIPCCIQSLIHASECSDTICHLRSCQKIKNVVQHIKICKLKTNGGCQKCEQFIAFCSHHAESCLEKKCPVPFCLNIKHKLKQQQQLQQRLQEAQLLCSQMVVTETPMTVSTGALPGNSVAGALTSGPVSPAELIPSPPNTSNMIVKDIQPSSTPGIGLEHGIETPSPNFIKVMRQETRKLSIPWCVQSLVHACECSDANCHLPSCQKIKRVVQHPKICKRKTNGGCRKCKQFIAFCSHHAEHCVETKCPVPFCLNIRHKLKQQQLQQRLQQAQLLRRRMAVMNTHTTEPTGSSPGNSVAGALTSGAVSPAALMASPPNTNNMIVEDIPPSYTGLKPATQTTTTRVVKLVQQGQEESAHQVLHVQGLNRNVTPGIVVSQSQVMLSPQMQRPLNEIGPDGGPQHIPVDQRIQRYPTNPAHQENSGLRQSNPQMIQSQQVVQISSQQQQQALGDICHTCLEHGPSPNMRQPGADGCIVTSGAGSEGNAPAGFAGQKQALQQLLATLKSPNTPEQQQQILHILKNNPQLMAEFMKQRQTYQLNQAKQNQVANTSGSSGTASQKQALQQLLAILKLPNTSEQQEQILNILKSNPQLMTAIVKQRNAYELKQANQSEVANTDQEPGNMVPSQQSPHLSHITSQRQQQQEQQLQEQQQQKRQI